MLSPGPALHLRTGCSFGSIPVHQELHVVAAYEPQDTDEIALIVGKTVSCYFRHVDGWGLVSVLKPFILFFFAFSYPVPLSTTPQGMNTYTNRGVTFPCSVSLPTHHLLTTPPPLPPLHPPQRITPPACSWLRTNISTLPQARARFDRERTWPPGVAQLTVSMVRTKCCDHVRGNAYGGEAFVQAIVGSTI